MCPRAPATATTCTKAADEPVFGADPHSATCRLNATLCERCCAMTSILRKPRQRGQSISTKLSTHRGALQLTGQYGALCTVTGVLRAELMDDSGDKALKLRGLPPFCEEEKMHRQGWRLIVGKYPDELS